MEPLKVIIIVSNSTIYARLWNTLTMFIYSIIHLFTSLFLFFYLVGKVINRRMVQRLVNTELEKMLLGRPKQNPDYFPRQNVIRLLEMFLNKTRNLACKH